MAMISPGTEVFLRVHDDPCDEPLHRGRLRGNDCGSWTVELAGTSTPPATGQRILVHCELDGEFTRQAAIVMAVDGVVVELQPAGEPVSAERRRERRVPYLHVLQRIVKEPLAG